MAPRLSVHIVEYGFRFRASLVILFMYAFKQITN